MPIAKFKQVVSSAVLLFGVHIFVATPGVARIIQASDPLVLYGKEIAFDVLREGEKVGHHRVVFSRTPHGDISVDARFELQITFLTIPVYKYLYQSVAVWRDGLLKTLHAHIDDDGEKTTVRALTERRKLSVTGPNGRSEWLKGLYPTNHWNAGVLFQTRVLNTLNGDISRVQISAKGREGIRAEGTWVQATKYQYSGDIDTTVWYDDAGRWVKMRFTAKGGSVIEYQCTRCGLGKANKAAAN